jgi:hypothetical protein
MKKFDLSLLLILLISVYTALLLRDYLSLIIALPISYLLYRNLQKEAITPMVNYLIMLIGTFSIFLFPYKAHSAIVLLTSFIAIYIFKNRDSKFYIGSIFLAILAVVSNQMEIIAFLPIAFLFTLRELKANEIKISKMTLLLIGIIIVLVALIPNYQGIIRSNSISSQRLSMVSPTESSTYVENIYNFSTTKPSTGLQKKIEAMQNSYNTLKLQQKILSWITFVGFVVAALVLITLLYKYAKFSGKLSLMMSMLITMVIIVGLGFGFYKLISTGGNWKELYLNSISYGSGTNFVHKVTKIINIKPLADKLTSLKINIGSMYLIIAEIVLSVFVLIFALKKILSISTKKIVISKEKLESKKTWFEKFGLSSDIFELYNQFRSSFGNVNLTPREFKEYFSSQHKIDISDITQTFEKARYEGRDLETPEKKQFIDKILNIINKLLD